jgi:hypothetical protein
VELSPRDPDEPPATSDEHPIPSAVAIECCGCAVNRSAIELNDHSTIAPDAIALDPAASDVQPCIDFGPRQAAPIEELQKACLELAARHLGPDGEASEDRPDPPDTPASGIAVDEVRQRKRIQKAPDLRFVHRSLDLMLGEDRREVEEGTRHRRHRNVTYNSHLVVAERQMMHADPSQRPPCPAKGDLDQIRCSDSPQGCGGPVAEDGTGAHRKYGRNPDSFSRQGRVPDCINASSDRV